MALSTQVLLKIDRVDQAEAQVRAMSSVDDDATLTQLASAWTNMQLVSVFGDFFAFFFFNFNHEYCCNDRQAERQKQRRDEDSVLVRAILPRSETRILSLSAFRFCHLAYVVVATLVLRKCPQFIYQ